MKLYTWTNGTTVLDLSEDIQVPMRTKRVVPLEDMGDFAEEKSDAGDKPGHPFHGNQYTKKDDEHNELPSDVVGPKKKNYQPPAQKPASYWPQKPSKGDAEQGQLSFGMAGVSSGKSVQKLHLRALPNVGQAFFPDKPGDVTEINGVAFTEPPSEFWKDEPDQHFESEPPEINTPTKFEEDYYTDEEGVLQVKKIAYQKRRASGAVVREPDGRIWLVEPNHHYAGYDATYPKGGVEEGLSPQKNALKEVYEESGLQVKLKDFLFDMEGDDSVTRYYLAERVGGNPYLAGEETYSDRLVTLDEAAQMVNRTRDKKILEQLHHRFDLESKSEAEAYLVSPEVAAPDDYFDDKLDVENKPKMPYDYGEDEAEPLGAIELVPLALYFDHLVRLAPVRAPLLTNEDPNQVAADAAQEELGTDNIVVVSWRPDAMGGEVITYAVIMPQQGNLIATQNFPITPISNVALEGLDDNGVALDAIEKLTNQAFTNIEFRNGLPDGWFEAMREYLPGAGREINVNGSDYGDGAGDRSNPIFGGD